MCQVRSLAGKAKENKLKPEEFLGGTFTVSNLGMFGVKQFTAIINAPQAQQQHFSRTRAKFSPAAPAQAASRTSSAASIVNAPQACILAVGGAETKAVPDGAGGVSTKSVMLVSLSSDHRVVDGALASAWLQSFKRHMENPLLLVL